MVDKSRVNKLLSLLAIIVILLFSSGSFALAQDGGGAEYKTIQLDPNIPGAPQAPVPGGPGFLMIHASAFTPYNQATLYVNDYYLRTFPNSPSTTYTAPVNLPQGATVTQLTYYFSDTDTSLNSSVMLKRWPVPGNTVGEMAAIGSPTSPEAVWTQAYTNTINYPLINNQANTYFIELSLPAAVQPGKLIGAVAVRIDYGFPVSLPAVIR